VEEVNRRENIVEEEETSDINGYEGMDKVLTI